MRNANTNVGSLLWWNSDRNARTTRSRVRFDFRTVSGKIFSPPCRQRSAAGHKLSPKPNSQFDNYVDPATAVTTYRTILVDIPRPACRKASPFEVVEGWVRFNFVAKCCRKKVLKNKYTYLKGALPMRMYYYIGKPEMESSFESKNSCFVRFTHTKNIALLCTSWRLKKYVK